MNGDDRNYDEQFDQCESARQLRIPSHWSGWFGPHDIDRESEAEAEKELCVRKMLDNTVSSSCM